MAGTGGCGPSGGRGEPCGRRRAWRDVRGAGHVAVGWAALAAGDLAAAHEAREATRQAEGVILGVTWAALHVWNVEAALVEGDLPAARGCAEDAILATKGTKGHYEVAHC